jgi:hypothetical protein
MPTLTYKKDSFLKFAGFIDDTFLDVNNLPTMLPTENDEAYIISAKYAERPDLLAYDLYGSTRLWWVFTLRNPDLLKDPIRDFKEGVRIILPSADSVNVISGNG